MDLEALVPCSAHFANPPPNGHKLPEPGNVLWAGNYRDSVEDSVVDVLLAVDAVKTIPLTLDLETVKRTADHGDIHPGGSLAEPKFLYDKRSRCSPVLNAQ